MATHSLFRRTASWHPLIDVGLLASPACIRKKEGSAHRRASRCSPSGQDGGAELVRSTRRSDTTDSGTWLLSAEMGQYIGALIEETERVAATGWACQASARTSE